MIGICPIGYKPKNKKGGDGAHMVKPLVSFVIPVLNAQRDIPRCLRSIQQLTFPKQAYEVIIVDNGSTDDTHQIIQDLGFTFLIRPDVHVAALRNYAATRSRGDFIAFVDADVELSPDWLQHSLATFHNQEERQVVACGCFPAIPPNATWVQKVWDIQQRGRIRDGAPQPIAWLPSMNLIVRRPIFEAVGGFDEQLETTEDVDLCYRLGQYGTILQNTKMEAIHWGEAPDLRTFWRKEVWRATGSLKGVWRHGIHWDELPSIGYPLYILCAVLFLIFSSLVDITYQQFVMVPINLALLILPALALAIYTVQRAKQPAALLRLSFLYLLYGAARAYAVIKPHGAPA